MDETEILKKRLVELSDRSRARGVYESTDFLNLAQQSVLQTLQRGGKVQAVTLYGGVANAERKLAVFGSADDCGYDYIPEIKILKLSPVSEKFGEELSHRDVLGAVLSLGIKRELTGDILIDGKTAYIVVKEAIADYIAENLKSVRHTDVICRITDAAPDDLTREPAPQTFLSSSERLDCIIAAVYNISRNTAKELFAKERVFIDGALKTNPSAILKENEIVSVRGKGRFIYKGIENTTKKGRYKISVAVFG
ncbi:MAG: hypothetical protein IJ766_06205 [Clostridia bacterium]|nr:hypothetical protein [Clostridia bacterium]